MTKLHRTLSEQTKRFIIFAHYKTKNTEHGACHIWQRRLSDSRPFTSKSSIENADLSKKRNGFQLYIISTRTTIALETVKENQHTVV